MRRPTLPAMSVQEFLDKYDDGTRSPGLSQEDIAEAVNGSPAEPWFRALEIIQEAAKAYEELASLLGPSLARFCWISLTRSPQGGAPKGSRDPRRDAQLLYFYDQAALNDPDAVESGALPRLFAERMMQMPPPHVAASAPALEKRIRMSLKARKKTRGL
jgi:hypothetical protein